MPHFKIIYLLVGLSFQHLASAAETMSCNISSAVRCPCPASMVVQCSDGRQGFIGNDEKVSSVMVTYRSADGTEKNITLTHPKSTARAFYAANSNDEVKAALKNAGITVKDGDQIDVKSLTVAKSAKLYDDPQMQKENSKSDPQISSDEKPLSCAYKGYQRVVTTSQTRFKKTCVSWATCDFKNGTVNASVECAAPTGACPQDALECANSDGASAFSPEDIAKIVCSKSDGVFISGCQMSGTSARISGGLQGAPSGSNSGSDTSMGSAQ